jgi:aminopeptidase N
MKRYLFLVPAFFSLTLNAQDLSSCQHRHQQGYDAIGQKQNGPSVQADNQRSDTIDLLKLTITLDITDLTTDTIRGNTMVHYAPKLNNISSIDLDLLRMTIDSVKENNVLLSYTYDDTLLRINLGAPHNTTDTNDLTVYYHGKPQLDPAGWGGFYFQPPYVYNLGVGFGSDPHVFGRVWFPCFDNFVERSTYEFNIGTSGGKIAYCNGLLARDTTIGTVRWRRWNMNKTIPSYLASVSIAPYTQVNWTFNGMNGPTPIILTALPADTTPMKNSFKHLDSALLGFEYRYGPYRWDRVGYCLVPFNSGAMEHATNISYPRVCANGTLTYEASIMAHELSHHWWGDNATCQNEGEMWLNEGWASYSEHIFTEYVYGYPAYIAGIRANHDDMVHYVHLREGGYLVEDSIPHQYTYGDHVYLRGADLAHTLRGYMGDSLFFLGLKYHMNAAQYKDVSSLDFRDNLIAATGLNTVLTSYFNDWILHPGWPAFILDSFAAVPNGNNYDVTIYVKQKLRGAPNYFNNVPLEITFKSAAWTTVTRSFIFSGAAGSFTFTLPFSPAFACIDLNDKIGDAVTTDTKVIKTTGTSFGFLSEGRMQINALNVPDSAFVHVDHYWVAPDPFVNPWGNGYRLSDHYWSFSGLFPPAFYGKATVTYDGRSTITSGGGGQMDVSIIPTNNLEDSMFVLYRKDAASDWTVYPYFTRNIGSPTDKWGTIILDSIRPGQYTIGRKDHTMGLSEQLPNTGLIRVYPNPANEEVVIEFSNPKSLVLDHGSSKLQLLDLNGKVVTERELGSADHTITLNVSGLEAGAYFVRMLYPDGQRAVTKVVIGK